MKTLYGITILMLVSFASTNAQAQTQGRKPWESDGLTSVVTDAEMAQIKRLPRDAKADIDIALNDVKKIPDPTEAKNYLMKQADKIKSYSKGQENRLLLVQSLASGTRLSDYLQDNVVRYRKEACAPGTVRQQVRILKHAFEQAARYYKSDQEYVTQITNQRAGDPKADTGRKSGDWAYFGLELSAFISKMSAGIMNAKANYAINRFAAGVLERKLYDDHRRTALATPIQHLDDVIRPLPNPIEPGYSEGDTREYNDIVYTDYTRKVKDVVQTTQNELASEFADLKGNFN